MVAASLACADGWPAGEAPASFRAITSTDLADARAWVVRADAYPPGDFAELARRSPLESAEQHLRLINGVYGGGEIRPGQLVKVGERQ